MTHIDEATDRVAVLDYTLGTLEAKVLATLARHRGRATAIRAADLAAAVHGVTWQLGNRVTRKSLERDVQHAVHRLRVDHRAPIASAAGRPCGYYLAETAQEVDACYREQRAKALSTLAAMAALRRVELQELLAQLATEVAG